MKNLLGRLYIALLIVGAVLAYMGTVDFLDGRKTPVVYEDLMEADVKKNMIVEGDLYANLGPYEEEYTTTNGVKTGSSKYSYLIPIGEKQYMGFKNQTDEQAAALDRQAEQVVAVMLGESTEQPEVIHFKGKVKSLDKKDRGYMRDYLLELGYTEAEVDGYILPYRIEVRNFDAGLPMMIGGVVLLAFGALFFFILSNMEKKEQPVYTPQPTTVSVNLNDDFDAWMNETNYEKTDEQSETKSDYRPEDTSFDDVAEEAAITEETAYTDEISYEKKDSGYDKETFGEKGSTTSLRLKL